MEPAMVGVLEFDVSSSSSETETVLPLSRSPSPLDANMLDILDRFGSRSIYSIGTADTVELYKKEMFKLAVHHPFLLHMISTFVLMHDRSLTGSKQSAEEAYHWYAGTVDFNRLLSGPIRHSDKDALWACAAILGAITISAIDAKTPEEAWPMKAPSLTDLDWLQISDGKKAIWKLSEPTRPDSVWHPMMKERTDSFLPKTNQELRELPNGFFELFELDKPRGNPYWDSAAVLSNILDEECNYSNVLKFLSFIAYINDDFKMLLKGKDLRAMLLLCYWYAKMAQYKNWWTRRRSILEGISIVMYLEKHYGYDAKIMELVQIPKAMFVMGGL